MSSRPIRVLATAVVLAGTVVLLTVGTRGVDWGAARSGLDEASWALLAAATATVILATLVRAWRWRLLFAAPISVAAAWRILIVGQALNIVLPARLGEGARVYLAGRMRSAGLTQSASTIVLEKLLDSLTFLAIVVALSTMLVVPDGLVTPLASITAVVVTTFAALGVAIGQQDVLVRCVRKLPPAVGRISLRPLREGVEAALDHLSAVARPGLIVALLSLSFATWGLAVVANGLVSEALDLRVPLAAPFVVLLVVQLGTAVPTTPARIGVFESLCVAALAPFGVPFTDALLFGILLHIVAYAPPLVLGGLFAGLELREAAAALRLRSLDGSRVQG